jgi:hypothetical protein
MHVVLINVTLNDPEAARAYLESDIVPNVKQAPGFVAGYWYGDEGQRKGAATIAFDSEENANALLSMLRDQEGPGHATIDNIEVQEVVASA